MSTTGDTCKYMILGAVTIAICVILFAGDKGPCINCKPKEVVEKPKVKKQDKPKDDSKKEEKVKEQKADISGYDGGDFASF